MGFVEDYFLNPILSNGWFNPVNTAVYAVGLIIGVWLVYKLLVKMKVPIDRRFGYAVLPFIFWGSSTRVLHDAAVAGILPAGIQQFYAQPFFPTPGSYFITFGLALAVLLVSLLVQRAATKKGALGIGARPGVPYWKIMAAVGVLLSLVNVALIPWRFWLPALVVIPVWLIWSGLFWLVGWAWSQHWLHRGVAWVRDGLSPVNRIILAAHFLDASATYFALKHFGYLEQHFLPRTLFGISDPISFFVLKVIVVLPVLLIIDRATNDGKASSRAFRNLLKLVVLILGLAPGLRDLLRMIAGV